VKNLIKYFLGATVVVSIGVFVYLFNIVSNLPSVDKLAEYRPPIPSKIFARNGELLLKLGREERDLVKIENIPPTIIDTFLAAEDDTFYEHDGIDLMGIFRAALVNLKSGGWVQGGSTITQQVAKKLLLTSDKTIERKLKDMMLAMIIERNFSKNEILYLYLNQVYLGGGFYGIKAAFKGYFGKELDEVTPAEAALITGLLVAPTKYSPYKNPKYSKIRQIYVLDRMLETKKITKEQYDQAIIERIKLIKRRGSNLKAAYFTDWIRQLVEEKVGTEEFLTGGYQIKTTLDLKAQLIAEKKVKEGVEVLDKRQGFKGPINSVLEKEINQFIVDQKQEILLSKSKSLWLNPDGTLSEENQLSEEQVKAELEMLAELDQQDSELKVNKKHLQFKGVAENNDLVKLLDPEKKYKAIVTGMSDFKRVVYVNIAGIRGVIPQSDFSWAHDRNITEEIQYFTKVQRPSKILKTGDVVWVKLSSSRPKTLWSFADLKYRKRNLNSDVQKDLKQEKFYHFSLEQVPEAQSALISVDPHSGEILSMVGGVNFKKSQFNRVLQSKRQPGSSFKPIIYAMALEQGYTPSTLLVDTPQALQGVDETLNWKPKNYDGKFKGMLTFRKAVEESRNIPTILLVQDLGVEKIVEFLKRNRIDIEVPKDLSISLGSFGINLMQLVSLYSVFPNGGKRLLPKFITSVVNRDGQEFTIDNPFDPPKVEEDSIEEELENQTELVAEPSEVATSSENEKTTENKKYDFTKNLDNIQVYDQRLSFLMTSLLRGVVQNGTGKRARDISQFIGGKTGTTNNYVDSWFVGFSQNTVTGVWVGFDDNTTLGGGETGSRAALPIWKNYMREVLKLRGENDFKIPRGIINVAINPDDGTLASPEDSLFLREFFVEGTEPGGKFDFSKNTEELGLLDDDDYYSQQ
jgi:penicillin-binding protein 1A